MLTTRTSLTKCCSQCHWPAFALSSRSRRLESGWVRADYAWTPARHKCCGSAPGTTSTDSRSMKYQSCRLLSASSAQHATSALSLIASCQWPTSTTWRQSVAQYTITCDRLDPHCSLCYVTLQIVQAFISSCLDYCNSVLYGITDNLLQQLQSVYRTQPPG